jgi:two-component system, sensor histidine kinase and response regulator
MDDYLAKPFNAKTLLRVIKSWLKVIPESEVEPEITGEMAMNPKKSTSNTESPVSFSALEAIRVLDAENGDEFLRSIVDMYLSNTVTLLESLEKAWLTGNIDTIRSISHMLKSTSSQVGAQGLSELCLTVETAARNQQYDESGKSLDEIKAAFNEVQKSLESYLS